MTHLPSPTPSPPFDALVFNRLIMNTAPAELARLLATYRRDLERYLAIISGPGTTVAVSAAAHSLRGASLSLGFQQLADQLLSVEQTGAPLFPMALQQAVDEIRPTLEQLSAAYPVNNA